MGNNESRIEDTKPKHKRLTKKGPSTHAQTSPDDSEMNENISPSTETPSNRENLEWKSSRKP
ncbi:hypothetical protein BELL_0839g00030 [Botrytis elliptica]|uniref:Uncharacterized protein n=1 Tax=Botrytis elliptica TaxID=278938 RepID=A0A4Z1J3E3_9HELO|nr:hypothetical protein BELL_0839g00030 [Botrytis elliptica]